MSEMLGQRGLGYLEKVLCHASLGIEFSRSPEARNYTSQASATDPVSQTSLNGMFS